MRASLMPSFWRVPGLKRLGFDDRIGAAIDEDFLLPAGGQGAVGIEYRERIVALPSC